MEQQNVSGDLPEEMMLEPGTEACVGVEWIQAKGTACTTVLQRRKPSELLELKEDR